MNVELSAKRVMALMDHENTMNDQKDKVKKVEKWGCNYQKEIQFPRKVFVALSLMFFSVKCLAAVYSGPGCLDHF